jgi:hypothetical protein
MSLIVDRKGNSQVTPWSKGLFEKLIVASLVKNLGFYGTRTSICVTFRYVLFLMLRSYYPETSRQAGGPPLVGCLQQLIQYICNLSTLQALVTRFPHAFDTELHFKILFTLFSIFHISNLQLCLSALFVVWGRSLRSVSLL